MKLPHILALLGITLSTVAQTQTAHDYFNELKAANTFNHYKDEYVCFRDDDVPTFEVIAVSDHLNLFFSERSPDGILAR